MTMFPNLRWCSDGMEIRCFNGDKVFVAFALECCDREAFAYVARTAPLSADDIEELMVKAIEKHKNLPLLKFLWLRYPLHLL